MGLKSAPWSGLQCLLDRPELPLTSALLDDGRGAAVPPSPGALGQLMQHFDREASGRFIFPKFVVLLLFCFFFFSFLLLLLRCELLAGAATCSIPPCRRESGRDTP